MGFQKRKPERPCSKAHMFLGQDLLMKKIYLEEAHPILRRLFVVFFAGWLDRMSFFDMKWEGSLISIGSEMKGREFSDYDRFAREETTIIIKRTYILRGTHHCHKGGSRRQARRTYIRSITIFTPFCFHLLCSSTTITSNLISNNHRSFV